MKTVTKNATNDKKSKSPKATMTVAREAATVESTEQPQCPTSDDQEAIKAEAKAEIQNFEPIGSQVRQIVEELRPNASQRIKNAKDFGILSERYNFLKGKAEELVSFKLSNAETNTRLKLRNQNGQEFEVTNSSVIEKCVAVISAELAILVADTENEVLNFVI